MVEAKCSNSGGQVHVQVLQKISTGMYLGVVSSSMAIGHGSLMQLSFVPFVVLDSLLFFFPLSVFLSVNLSAVKLCHLHFSF